MSARIPIHLVHEHGQSVGDDHLLEQPPQHQFEPVGHLGPVEPMDLAELVKQVLRPLDGPRDQLRIEHHVYREDARMLLRLLPAPVDLDDVGQALEGVKGQAQRQDDVQHPLRVVQTQGVRDALRSSR